MSELPSLHTLEGLPKLDVKDPMSWAMAPRLRDEWIRRVAPVFNIETSKYILGGLLGSIIGDDLGAFGSYGFMPDLARNIKSEIIERMSYEIESPELPDIIRSRLVDVSEALRGINLEIETGYWMGRNLWIKRAKNFTQKQIVLNPELKEAQEYSLTTGEEMEEFIDAHFFKTQPIKESSSE